MLSTPESLAATRETCEELDRRRLDRCIDYALKAGNTSESLGLKSKQYSQAPVEYVVEQPSALEKPVRENPDAGQEHEGSKINLFYQCNSHRGGLCDELFMRKEKANYCPRCGGKELLALHVSDFARKVIAREIRRIEQESSLDDFLDNFLDGTKSVAGVVASDLYNVAARVGNVAARAGKTAGRAAFKTLAYPICGNLSGNLQIKLENLVGNENYDAADASHISYATNLLIYPVVTGASLYYVINHFGAWMLGSGIGLFMGAGETYLRVERNAFSSIPGKLLSLPIEGALKLWELAGKYARSVAERAADKKIR